MKRTALALIALLAFGASADAQWQTPEHSIPVGRGAGVTGFKSVGPCTSNQVFVGAGASADPVCGSVPALAIPLTTNHLFIGNAGFATDVPMTGDCAISYLAGNGQLVCSMNADRITSGTLDTARLPSPFTNGTASGNTSVFATVSGATTSGNCIQYDASGNITSSGGSCGGGASAGKDYYVTASGNDSNDGLTWASAKLTIQAAEDIAATSGNVHVAGTHTLTAEIAVRPGVALICVPGATITQGAGQNLTRLVNFTTHSADGASMSGCTLDGNRANNTDNPANVILAYIGTANDVSVYKNIVKDSNGDGITVTTGVRSKIYLNKVINSVSAAIFVNSTTANLFSNGLIANNEVLAPIGETAIAINCSNNNLVTGNKIYGTLVGGTANPLVVDVSGSTVTWVSGPDFTNVYPGMFLITNSGTEYFITAKASTTSLTISTTASLSGVTAAIGSGDLISIANSSSNIVTSNTVSRGVSLGISLYNFNACAANAAFNSITNNYIEFIGAAPISFQSTTSHGTMLQNLVTGNSMYRPGMNAAGTVSTVLTCFYLNGADIASTIYTNNTCYDDLSDLQYGAIVSGPAAGELFFFGNLTRNAANAGVSGSVTTISGAMNNL